MPTRGPCLSTRTPAASNGILSRHLLGEATDLLLAGGVDLLTLGLLPLSPQLWSPTPRIPQPVLPVPTDPHWPLTFGCAQELVEKFPLQHFLLGQCIASNGYAVRPL